MGFMLKKSRQRKFQAFFITIGLFLLANFIYTGIGDSWSYNLDWT